MISGAFPLASMNWFSNGIGARQKGGAESGLSLRDPEWGLIMKVSGTRLRRALSPTVLLWACSCGDSGAPWETALVTDSAGVRIVQLPQSTWEQTRPVPLSSTPLLSIGAVDGSDDEILFRVSGGAVLEDGRIAVLDGGSRELRFYGTDGILAGRQGRTGDGPGEYRNPAGLWTLPGDTVVVWDQRLRRVTAVSPEGVVVREATVRGRPVATRVRGAFADGSLVLFQQRSAEEQSSMDQQFMGYFSRLAPSGDSLNALGVFPWRRMITTPPGESGGGMVLVESGPPVFDAETEVAATAQGLWVGTTKWDEVLWLNKLGEVERILRWAGPDRAVTDGVKEAVYTDMQERWAATAPPGATWERPQGMHFADLLPSHGELVAREDGGLWMREFSRPGAGGVNRWRVFGPDALPEGRLELPHGARVLWAGVDRVLLLERDEFDVEYVRLYALDHGEDGAWR
jgi:hypothetical protein